MKRLHPPSPEAMAGQASKSSLEFGEDVPASFHYAATRKKKLRFLSEDIMRDARGLSFFCLKAKMVCLLIKTDLC